MEEPSTTGRTSPGSRLHDEGDPSVEEVWDVVATLSGLAGAGTKPAGDAASSAAQGPPAKRLTKDVELFGEGGAMLRRLEKTHVESLYKSA
jgi:hypothetical protein